MGEFNLDNECFDIIQMREHIKEMQQILKQKEAALLDAAAKDVAIQLQGKDYGAGTATLHTDKHKIKVVLSKKITWDQDGLLAARTEIAKGGSDPDFYVKAKYDVSEAAYKQWPPEIQAFFEPHRTVQLSNPTLTIEEV